jgi:hypothetical protein
MLPAIRQKSGIATPPPSGRLAPRGPAHVSRRRGWHIERPLTKKCGNCLPDVSFSTLGPSLCMPSRRCWLGAARQQQHRPHARRYQSDLKEAALRRPAPHTRQPRLLITG